MSFFNFLIHVTCYIHFLCLLVVCSSTDSAWLSSLRSSYNCQASLLESQFQASPHLSHHLTSQWHQLISQTRCILTAFHQFHTQPKPLISSPQDTTTTSSSTTAVRVITSSPDSTDAGYASDSSSGISAHDLPGSIAPATLSLQLASPVPPRPPSYSTHQFAYPSSHYTTLPDRLPAYTDSHSSTIMTPMPPAFLHLLHNMASTHPSSMAAAAAQQKYFAPHARIQLEEWYQARRSAPYASDAVADQLALQAGITRGQVLKWLSNRRNRDGNTKKRPSGGRRCKKPYSSKQLLF